MIKENVRSDSDLAVMFDFFNLLNGFLSRSGFVNFVTYENGKGIYSFNDEWRISIQANGEGISAKILIAKPDNFSIIEELSASIVKKGESFEYEIKSKIFKEEIQEFFDFFKKNYQ